MTKHSYLGALVVALWLALGLASAACGPTSKNPGGGDGGGNPGDCDPGTADCDGDSSNGCEADLATIATCGTCDISCGTANAPGAACLGGACSLPCDTGFGDCNGNPADG